MAELFFSYSAKDRERVRPIHEALTALGFDVSWDQLVPAGWDWDTWIRDQLASARCVVVFWSLNSVVSDNIRHEATIAKEEGKIAPVMLDALRVGQFPMGLFNTQAARLIEWSGDGDDPEWRKLLAEIESKVIPVWAARRIANLDAELKAEAKRRETAQAGEDAVAAQLTQEIAKQGQLRRDRERAQADTETARAELAGLKEALDAAKAQNSDMAERLVSAERLTASARKRLPVAALAVAVMLALGIGASVAYFAQEARWTKRAALAINETQRRVEAETRQRLEVEWRERADAEQAKAERLRLEADAQERQRRAAREAEQQRVTRETRERETVTLAEKRRRILQNTGLIGAAMQTTKGTTVEDCRASCLSDARCKAFEFRIAVKQCGTFSAITEQYSAQETVAGRWD